MRDISREAADSAPHLISPMLQLPLPQCPGTSVSGQTRTPGARPPPSTRSSSSTGTPVCWHFLLQDVLLLTSRVRAACKEGDAFSCAAHVPCQKKRAAFSRASVRVGGSFIRPMQTAQTTSRLMYPKTDSVRSNAPVAAATFPQVYPVTQTALPKSYPVTPCHSRREHHCQAGHFPLHAKNRSSENSDDLFSVVSAPTYFPGPLPAKYLRRK